jgi:AAA domain, putative AbiEii toxin, Type IV TA system/AAA domain
MPLKLPDLTIEGFRGFERFHFPKLARVNLLVGPNNAGKTTVLEAVEMLAANYESAIFGGLRRRGEMRQEGDRFEIDYAALFHGFVPSVGSRIELSATGLDPFVVCLVEPDNQFFGGLEPPTLAGDLQFTTQGQRPRQFRAEKTGLAGSRMEGGMSKPPLREPVFLDASRRPEALGKLWDAVAIIPEEEQRVVQALRILAPDVVDLRFSDKRPFVGLEGRRTRLPLSSMGEGMNRLLALALHLAKAADNVLLIDEIDTGLYYRTLPQVWRLVMEAARRLDVQVFATTHSQDCVAALDDLYRRRPDLAGDVLVHRIDPGAERPVTYDLAEVSRSVESLGEVR